MSKLQKEERSNKIKGTSWLLEDTTPFDKQNTKIQQRQKRIEQNMRSQDKKWKKNTNNRFQGYNKKIQQMVKTSFQEENNAFDQFHYDSMRKTDSSLHQPSKDPNFTTKRKIYQNQMFQMRRKERQILSQISKMEKLKEITSICEQKKNFYDGCVDRYFEDYKKDINKTINQIGNKLQRNSKRSFCGRPILL